ncbi:tripeptidyl-peptidase 2 isoform X2 [Nymphaea colorata]|uniref:tripeptidyl-peptidase 2 isoform X2 n=1 Tax=Nymphaea colorata TaxID=210225 RepID=UPI00129D54A5|nr:tripeptidyl-peptidase 2 isoform X2 [Nymphaea colorata]
MPAAIIYNLALLSTDSTLPASSPLVHCRPLRRGGEGPGRLELPAREMPSAKTSGDLREVNGAVRSLCLDESTFLAALMPKEEIGAKRFLEAHPEYDGRGTLIAIFDSGVDPAAAGLHVTSDGKPKILDILDCTGSGDIDTSKVVKADADGCIIGASGVKLFINQQWKNPSGEWHVGCKLIYELFTDALISRLKKERKKKWDERNQEAISDALKALNEFDQKHPKADSVKLKKTREDLQNKVDLLRKQADIYDDRGPVIDAVVWNDGDVWRVAVDTQQLEEDPEFGKLANFNPMTNFRTEHKYGIFSKLDVCSFVTNIYDEGNILSIVTDCSPHATHVAGIAAAFHPEEPLLNGVAPGAQLISCKIGDSRLGSMETGTGLIRALIAVVEHKCDLINMSYGEPTLLPDYGRFVDLVNEVVDKHRVIFISSAGNNGPALTTVGAPGGTSSSIFGVGAYVSPAMAAAAHCVVDPPPEGLEYTWSSRGPTTDGDLGVCISAPGGAVAPVPTWTLQRRMLMNGTSMASPSACGAVALLVSAMKAEGIPVSPYSMRNALQNTAIAIGNSPEDKLSTGEGLIQVDRAYEYLQQSKSLPCVTYKATVSACGKSGPTARGIYLRESSASERATEWTVQIQPKFHEDASYMDQLVPFEECIQLHSSEPLVVQAPEYILLTNNGRTFNIVINPTNLSHGLHYFEVYGTDCRLPWRGSLFRVPITVIKPLTLQDKPPIISFTGMAFSPGYIERKFIKVPKGATWVEATMRTSGFDTARRFFINVVQICPLKRPIKWENVVTFSSSSLKRFNFPIQGGQTMELAIAQFWSSGVGSNDVTFVDFEMEFHGIEADQEAVMLDGSEAPLRIEAKAPLSSEQLRPIAVLKKIRTPYRPSDCSLFPLPEKRDLLPTGKQILALILTYKFKLEETAEITPRLPLLNNRIYDNKFESQFYMVSDSNKRIYGTGDVYPKPLKLPKGDYTLRMSIRHENIHYLEKMKELVLFIERNLEAKDFIHLSCFSQPDGPITGNSSFTSLVLVPGEREAFYVGPPPKDKLPKCCSAGSILLGEISYGSLSLGAKEDGKNTQTCPVFYPLSYMVPPKLDEKDKEKDGFDSKKSLSERVDEEVRYAKLNILSSLKQGTEDEVCKWKDFCHSLKMEYPNCTPLLVKILEGLLSRDYNCGKASYHHEVINAANEVISSIDKDELAKYFSEKSEPEDEEGMKLKKKMEATRDQLVEALYRKGLALLSLQVEKQPAAVENLEQSLDLSSPMSGNGPDLFEQNFKELRRWVEVKSPKYVELLVFNERRCGRPGTALKILGDLLQDGAEPPNKKFYELKIDLLDDLGWAHIASYERRWMFVRFPPCMPLF